MTPFIPLYNQVAFFFSTLTFFGFVDLLLVTITFYFLLSLIRRSSAAYLLREVMVLGVVLFVLITLLPLPVFDWLVRAVLVATLVAIPIIYQVQLRRFIERAGHAAGISQIARQNAIDLLLPELGRTLENLSSAQTGALIAFEGNDSLDELTKSGVAFAGQVTSELLESIFYPGTPLHDGATIIRAAQIVAAGCVLPLTRQSLPAEKRLGTRHRAAVGLTEQSDALTIVVSEETGQIGVAYQGQLERPLTVSDVQERLFDFYLPTAITLPALSFWQLIRQAGQKLWQSASLSNTHQLLSNIGLLVISLMLALVVWSFVIEQTNPIKPARVESIILRVENVPPKTRLIPPPPTTVSAIIQTTESVLPTLNSRAFQAVVSLEESAPGLYRLPVHVSSSAAQVLVLSADPPALDLELAPIISRTMPVMIEILPQQGLSAAYELVGSPTAGPHQVNVIGPAPVVEQVDRVQATISLANAGGPLRELRSLRALDEQGREITQVTLQPNQVQVNVNIRRRLNALSVSVRPVTSGSPPSGYWLSNLSVAPTGVTLQGHPNQLAEIGGFVDTLPVDISQAAGILTIQTPLDLPTEVKAVDSEGRPVEVVTVVVQVDARRGDLAVTRLVELLKTTPGITVTLNPPQVDLLLNGPLPILSEIEANPNLLRVSIDPTDLGRNQSTDVTPTVVAPPDIQVQLVPASVLVIVE